MFYVIGKSVNGKEYIHHGGYVHANVGTPNVFDGYRTKAAAKAQVSRLTKLYKQFAESYGGQNETTFRIEEM